MAATSCCTFAEPQEFLQQHSSTLCPAFPLRVHQQLEMLLGFFLPLPRATRGSGKGNHWSFIARTIILYLLEKVFCLSFLLPCMILTCENLHHSFNSVQLVDWDDVRETSWKTWPVAIWFLANVTFNKLKCLTGKKTGTTSGFHHIGTI